MATRSLAMGVVKYKSRKDFKLTDENPDTDQRGKSRLGTSTAMKPIPPQAHSQPPNPQGGQALKGAWKIPLKGRP